MQEHITSKGPEPGATRLEVGPRESRAGSRVPRYTSSGPTVPATCQGGAVHAPGAPPGGGTPSHVLVEAPCSVLAVDTAKERLCPCTSGSTMLRAGDKQLRAASRLYQPQGAPELSVRPHRNASPRESRTRGLGTGAALGSRPSVRHPTRSPGPGSRTPLPSRASARAKV